MRTSLPSQLTTVFLDRDGVINQEPGPILRPEQFRFIPQSPESIAQINQMNWLCIVITNQAAIAKGLLTEDVFQQITHKMETELHWQNAHIDALYYCPDHPDWQNGKQRKHARTCPRRKPGTGMLEEAIAQHALDPQECIFIADATSDFEAAFRMKITSIGVRTGHAGKDGNCNRDADYWANNLFEAVSFLKRHYSHH